ncbi:MAG: hypothetical protein V4597_08590 [Pseudomonadota bacterium]
MNVLLVGGGQGSWTMRGIQLGRALGGRSTSSPTRADWDWAEVVVLVKRSGARHAGEARAAGKPVVWDAVDCWGQPSQNGYDERAALDMLRGLTISVAPTVAVAATRAQAAAFAAIGVPSCYLPHHSWDGLEPAEARAAVSAVAYQGNPGYLGRWDGILARLCRDRGWRFAVNPPDLREADLLVALRDGPWDGWMPRQWKSGVKLVNAVAAGRPVIAQPSAAHAEIGPPGSTVETEAQLAAALDAWADPGPREAACEACRRLAPAYTLSAVAEAYAKILRAAMEGRTCGN